LKWGIENPEKGFVYPDDIPKEFILKYAKPFLGKVVSEPMPWRPESTQFIDMTKMAQDKLRRLGKNHFE